MTAVVDRVDIALLLGFARVLDVAAIEASLTKSDDFFGGYSVAGLVIMIRLAHCVEESVAA